jgi:ArsR family transcriptional regulator, arsenate/arsenite/antimonite-responsive transcriptional repressor
MIEQFSLDKLCGFHAAIMDEARFRLMYLIYKYKEMCPTDLEMITEFSQSKTSRQLNSLKKSGLLHSHRKDQYQFFYIPDVALSWTESQFEFATQDTTLQKDLETARILMSNRELVMYRLENKRYSLGLRQAL